MSNLLLVPDELYEWIVETVIPTHPGPIKKVSITVDRSEI